MALHHARSGDLISLQPLGEALAHTPTHTLVQSPHLELFRLVLAAGKAVPEHQVPGPITVHCLEGELQWEAAGQAHTLRPGQLVYLAGQTPHSLMAVSDCSVLVTLVRLKH
jgi:quercetin dioxygenase-like cupin family protein